MNVIHNEIRDVIEKELVSACEKFPMFASLHEASAVIFEEYQEAREELEDCLRFFDLAWQQIRLNNSALALNHITRMKYASERLAIEACQMSAMCEKAIQSERGKYTK